MKIAVKLLLIVFLTFLMTPTIVCVLEKSTDVSAFYSLSEEELAHKEIKAAFYFETSHEIINLARLTSSLILSENLSKHDKIASTILIPPPERL